MQVDAKKLAELGAHSEQIKLITKTLSTLPAEQAWDIISKKILTPQQPFKLHLFLFTLLFPDWLTHPESAPAWQPDLQRIAQTNLAQFMQSLNLMDRKAFHQWSVLHFDLFWQLMVEKLGIVFQQPPEKICDLSAGVEKPQWLVGAHMNISESCFTALPEKTAIVYQDEKDKTPLLMSYGELNQLSNQIANSLISLGFKSQDAIAINMPMTPIAVAIYLGIVKMGGVVVSIADSFSPTEIATRLRIADAKAIFTQDASFRNGKTLPLYEKVMKANSPRSIVFLTDTNQVTLRKNDLNWQQFLNTDDSNHTHYADPMAHINILFSSGTTGDPKAIPWNHTTAIKAASDAYLHQDIQPHDIVAWPTNLGWMMGPWLIFAGLINQATIALYDGLPTDRAFGQFIQDAKVTVLGVVPTIVARWRQTNCMQDLDWRAIKAFSSTGECSNPEDMLYLMSLAGYKPIIEYCGGTEIGGAYVTSTLIENNYPSLFTTPTMGTDFILMDEQGKPAQSGDVALIPPVMGLSTELLNTDHHQVYYANMPTAPDGKILRRHGDQLKRYDNGLYCMLGRSDDTMNLGGIKTSAAEIERAISGVEHIQETAAIAVSLSQGPSVLVVYAATRAVLDKETTKKTMQQQINQHLNPLFKIHDIIFVAELPKTASNKIMRRVLRERYVN